MNMNIRYDGKTVLVTGGTAGIGLACAQVFAGLGAKVAICGTNQAKLDKALQTLRAEGAQVWGEVCDVSSVQALNALADHIEAALGPIDVWVSNAGVMPNYSLIDIDEKSWDQVMDVNVKGVCMGAQSAFRSMKDRRSWRPIISGSTAISPASSRPT